MFNISGSKRSANQSHSEISVHTHKIEDSVKMLVECGALGLLYRDFSHIGVRRNRKMESTQNNSLEVLYKFKCDTIQPINSTSRNFV